MSPLTQRQTGSDICKALRIHGIARKRKEVYNGGPSDPVIIRADGHSVLTITLFHRVQTYGVFNKI